MARMLAHTLCRLTELGLALFSMPLAIALARWFGL